MQRLVVISYGCFGTIYPFHVKVSRVSGNFWPSHQGNLTVSF